MFNIFKTTEPPVKVNDEVIVGFNSLIYDNKSFQHYDPDTLRIKKGNEVYQKMMTDEQVKAVLSFKKSAVVARGWKFDATEEQQPIADFFNLVLDEMTGSFTEKLKFIMSAMENGFSISEKVYKDIEFEGSPYWGIDDIKLKPWDTFIFNVDKYGTLDSISQGDMFNSNKIPVDKVIHWVNQPEKDRWYGESDLRSAYRAWWSKDITIRFQNIHLERHGSGFPVVTPGEKASTGTNIKSKIMNILNNMSVRTGIYMPKGYKFEMFSPEKTDAFEKAVAQHDKSISKSLLVPNLLGLSEQGQTGSYSQSQTQFDVFLWIVDDICKSLAEVLNEQLFAELALWNFGTKDFPKFKFDPMTEREKLALAKAWSELVSKRAVTNSDQDEAHTRNLLGYPEKEEVEEPEDDILEPEEPIDQFTFAQASGGAWLQRTKFKEIDQSLDKHDEAFSDDLSRWMGQARLSIENQIITIAGDRSFGNIGLEEFKTVHIPKPILTKTRKSTRKNLQSVFDENYIRAAAELPKKINKDQIVGMDRTRADRFLASKSIKITNVLDADVLKAVGQVLENAIKYDKTLKETILALNTDTAVVSLLPQVDAIGRAINVPARLENIARTNNSDAMNQSRLSLFGRPEFKGFIQAFEYSAILDDRTTDICETLNGRIKKDWAEYMPPNHFQCRSILVPVTVIDDWDGKEDIIPGSVQPLKGFG
jgi:SPP1 gp7 family putative phage head morphogenesis protein